LAEDPAVKLEDTTVAKSEDEPRLEEESGAEELKKCRNMKK
jgi:hypothetical protein